MMCAIRIVQKPELPRSPALTNSASSEEPITTSGVAIGRKISRLVAGPARGSGAAPARTPSACRGAVATDAWPAGRSGGCVTTESHMPLRPQGCGQLSSVKPSKS